MVARIRYLHTLCQSSSIRASALTDFDTGLSGYTTANPVHANEVREAVDLLREHFGRKNVARPLNSVILGGPGSGKTYLAQQLRDATKSEFREFNLSQFHHPSEIQQCFVKVDEIYRAKPDAKVIVFFDEFDVRIDGIAATQYLIQPIYDGKMMVAGKELEFKRAAFLFSGSYLKERRVFDSIVDDDQLDLARILFDAYHDTYRATNNEGYRNLIWRKLLAVTSYDPLRQRHAAEHEVIAYVRSLEKISDFVSRVNGFVLELRNLNTPLNATRNHYRIELESKKRDDQYDAAAATPDPQIAAQLIALMDGLRRGPVQDRFFAYSDPLQPILQYKNLMLTDRLARTIDLLKRTHDSKGVRISRGLLHYLVTVPVVHGMRSLTTLVESLVSERGILVEPPNRGVYQRNIGRFEDYDSVEAMWARTRRHNPMFVANRLLKTDGSEILTVE